MDNKNKERKPRKKTIKIRLDDDVYDELQDLKLLGQFNTWQDVIIFFQNEKKGFKKVLVDENGHALKCLNALQKCGTNLNQIAKIANQNKQIDHKSFEEFQTLSHQIKKARAYFCKKIIPDFRSK